MADAGHRGGELVDIQPVLGEPAVSFEARVAQDGLDLRRTSLNILQVNVGKLCNQACHHWHVDAGPTKTEIMSRETIDNILGFLESSDIKTVDITGGAPELIPDYRYFVERVRGMGRHVIDRCNLTVLAETGQEDLAEFLAEQEVEVIASLPCYLEKTVN